MRNYTSMASTLSKTVDCRMICLELDYCQLPLSKMQQLVRMCCTDFEKMLEDSFVSAWHWNSRKMNVEKIHQKIYSKQSSFVFGCDADVHSSVVYDAKSLNSYDKKLKGISTVSSYYSLDYPNVISPYLNKRYTNADLQKIIFDICNRPGMKKQSYWGTHDARALFWNCIHTNNPSKCYGKISFCVALMCLGDDSTYFAHELLGVLKKAGNTFCQVSGRISLSSLQGVASCCAHMHYFSEIGCTSQSNNTHELFPYCYVPGVEWCNLLSPLQLKLLPNLLCNPPLRSDIIKENCSCGGIILRLDRPISSVDIDSLIELKKILYNSLYPGSSCIPIKFFMDDSMYSYLTKPRLQWEYLPIFQEELQITEDFIVFKHNIEDSTGHGTVWGGTVNERTGDGSVS